MIALTLAEVAERRRRRRWPAPPDARGDRVGRPSTRAPWPPATCSSPCAGERVDGARLLRRRRRRRRGRRALRPGPTTRCRASWSPTRSRRSGRLAAAVHARLAAGGLPHARHHRLVGQDLDQGPARPGAGRGRPDGEPARLVQQRHRPAAHRARAPTTDTRFLVLEMGARGSGHIARLCGVARPRIGVVLNVGSAHLGEFGSAEAIAAGQGRAGRGAARPTAPPCSTPTTRGCSAWRRAPRAGGHHRPWRRTPTSGPTTSSLDDAARARLHARRRRRAAPGARCRWSARTRWPTRCRPPPRPSPRA